MSPKPNLRSAPSLTTCRRQWTSKTLDLLFLRDGWDDTLFIWGLSGKCRPCPWQHLLSCLNPWTEHCTCENLAGCRELVQARDIHRSKREMCKSLVWVLGLCLSRYPFSAVIMTMSCAGITQREQQLSQRVRGRQKKPSWSAAQHTSCGVLVVVDGARK